MKMVFGLSFNRSLLMIIIIIVSVFSLWLKSSVPAFAIADAAHDDQLFVLLAYHMLQGDWLGEYNNLTHAKGLFYSIFIALSYALGLPLKLAEQAFYLGAAGLFSWVMSRLTRRNDVGILLFVVLAFNPVLLHPSLSRVICEGIYISLSLLVVATMIGALLLQDGRVAGQPLKGRVGWLIGLGCAFSAFWLTREEGIWILPALVPIIGAWSLLRWRYWRHNPPPGGTLVRGLTVELGVFVLPLACFLLVVGSVNLVNYVKYGVFRNNDFRSADFLSAYGAISRIHHDEWRNYVVFPRDARERAYAVVPAAAELRPFFEGSGGEQWRRAGCNQMGIDPCPEILSGWFMWALRDAVREAGYYRSAVDARDFYLRLASEINDACDSHQLDCLPARASMMPPFRTSYLPDAALSMWQLTGLLTRLGSGKVGAPPSAGAPQNVDLFFDLLSGGISPPVPRAEGTLTVKGWVASSSGSPQLWVENLDGNPFVASLTFTSAPDVDAAFAGRGFGTRRFELKTNCLMESCILVVRSQGQNAVQADIRTLKVGANISDAKSVLYIDSKFNSSSDSPPERTPATSARIRIQLEIARAIALGYAWVGPLLSIVACLGVFSAMIWRGMLTINIGLMAVVASCAAAVATRIVPQPSPHFSCSEINALPLNGQQAVTAISALWLRRSVAFRWLQQPIGRHLMIDVVEQVIERHPEVKNEGIPEELSCSVI